MENHYVGKVCPYCREPFKQDDVIVVCNTCGMPHHLTCWQANEGCATYGCKGLIDRIINREQTAGGGHEQGKLEVIFESTECKLQTNSPVLIEKTTLFKDTSDDSVFATCKFRSLTDKSINALLLDVLATDAWGNEAEGVKGFQLLDQKTRRESEFGQTTVIPIPNKNVRNINIVIRKVLYEDRSMEDCEESFSTVPVQVSLLSVLGMNEAVENYASKTTGAAKFVPVAGQKVWRCTCGATNPAGEDVCYRCKTSFTAQQSAFQPESIIAQTQAFLNEKRRKEEEIRLIREQEQRENEERFRRAQEEQARRVWEEKEAQKAKRRKQLKRVGISVLAGVLLAGAVYGIFWHLIPLIRYNLAAYRVENHEYDSAYDTYVALKDYKDSPEKATETVYQKAAYLESQEQFTEAAAEYDRILNYRDSKEKALYCRNEKKYRDAKAKYDAGDYDGAVTAFADLGSYSDSPEWVSKSKYAKATGLFEAGEFAQAADVFKELGNYEDSKDCMNESRYRLADTYYADKDYKNAYVTFEAVDAGYKDAKNRATDAKYLYAEECLKTKKYKDAADIYYVLSNYKNANEQYQVSAYAYAKECMTAKRYEEARTYLSKIKDYENSADILNEASYQAGLQCISTKDYKNAVNYLNTVTGYDDVKTRINEAKYAYVTSHRNSTDGTTYLYLTDLKAAGYSDSKKIYNELYAWKVTVTAINDSETSTVYKNSLSKYSVWYCHFTLSGGPPGGSTKIKYTGVFPNGGTSTGKMDEDWSSGWSGWCGFYYTNPYYGSAGTFTFKIFDGNGNLLAKESVWITN